MTVEAEVRATSAASDGALTDNDARLVAEFMTDDWVYVRSNKTWRCTLSHKTAVVPQPRA